MNKKIKLLVVVTIFSLSAIGCSDPEFENCTIEIITRHDTLRLDNAYVEFEGHWDGIRFKDNILIRKGAGEWNFNEGDITKMTLIYEAQDD